MSIFRGDHLQKQDFLNRAEIPQNSNYCDQPGITQGISHLLKFRLCDKTNKFILKKLVQYSLNTWK